MSLAAGSKLGPYEILGQIGAGGMELIDYALQIAHGLSAAHDKGIVHRDLKPPGGPAGTEPPALTR